MQGYKNNRIVFLDWLRVIACFMVMVVHSSECVYSNDYSFSFPSELGRWSVCLINGFVRPAVPLFRHYKIFCVNGKYGIQVEFRIFYFIALQNEEDYERKESSSA